MAVDLRPDAAADPVGRFLRLSSKGSLCKDQQPWDSNDALPESVPHLRTGQKEKIGSGLLPNQSQACSHFRASSLA